MAESSSKTASSRRGVPSPTAEVLRRSWQMPLLVVAVGAFGFGVWKFADPGPGPTAQEQVELARKYMKVERPEAAVEVLSGLLKGELIEDNLRGEVRLLIAEAVEQGQRIRRISLPENHLAIAEQTSLAKKMGMELSAADYRRWGESLEALRKTDDALEAYREAMQLDPAMAPALWRRVIEALIARSKADESEPIEHELQEYLKLPGLQDAEKGWALGVLSGIKMSQRLWPEARELHAKILELNVDATSRGRAAFADGRAAMELGDIPEAERRLRLARQLLTVREALDAEAAYLLGRIYQDRDKPDEAMSFYQDVLVSHPDSRPFVLARLGRGVARIMKGDDDAGLEDLDWSAKRLVGKASASAGVQQLVRAQAQLSGRANYQGTLEVLGLEKSLLPDPPADFWRRVSVAYARRAEQVERAAADIESESERQQMNASVRQLRTKAGDASFSHAMALTMTDNDGYGAALWRAMEFYDRAGAVPSTIAALELFTQERPSDSLAPEATLRLGRAYMAAGLFDKAIGAFQRNQFRYPRSWAAVQSAVPLAQALIARGATGYARAETVLLGVVDNNPALTPDAAEFRNALFELAQLYYRQGRHEESIARFDEVMKRYPAEERIGQVLFFMADGYRKSAALLAAEVKSSLPENEAEAARRERLEKARELFDRVVLYYRDRPPQREIDRAQYRMAHFYRADCAFDLGQYEEAVRLYDQAAFRYQDDASALAAYIQIVNANVALGRLDEARSANERARWLLRRMPASSFGDSSFALSRAYWERWLKWSGESNLWPGGAAGGARDAIPASSTAGTATNQPR